MLDPRVENTAEKLKELEKKVEQLEKLMKELIEKFNDHWHDVGQLEGYGLASYKTKYEFQLKKTMRGEE